MDNNEFKTIPVDLLLSLELGSACLVVRLMSSIVTASIVKYP